MLSNPYLGQLVSIVRKSFAKNHTQFVVIYFLLSYYDHKFRYYFSFSVFLITWVLALALIYSEVTYFLNPDHTFKFVPDKDYMGFVDMNVDMTVAMPCEGEINF